MIDLKTKNNYINASFCPVFMRGEDPISHFMSMIQKNKASLVNRINRRMADSIKEHGKASLTQHIAALNIRHSSPALKRVDSIARHFINLL